MSLIVTGSIGIDSVEAPTGIAEDVLGGSTIYFAAAASFFGPVRVVGAVGDDFPDQYMDTFEHFNIDTQGVERRTGSKTFRWRGKYFDDMNVRETLMQAARTKPTTDVATAEAARLVEGMIARPTREQEKAAAAAGKSSQQRLSRSERVSKGSSAGH